MGGGGGAVAARGACPLSRAGEDLACRSRGDEGQIHLGDAERSGLVGGGKLHEQLKKNIFWGESMGLTSASAILKFTKKNSLF